MKQNNTPRTAFDAKSAPLSTAASIARIGELLDAGETNRALTAIPPLGRVETLCEQGHGPALHGIFTRLTDHQRDQVISPEEFELTERASAKAVGERIERAMRDSNRKSFLALVKRP